MRIFHARLLLKKSSLIEKNRLKDICLGLVSFCGRHRSLIKVLQPKRDTTPRHKYSCILNIIHFVKQNSC